MNGVVVKSDPRAALREAIDERERAQAALVRAQQAEGRASALLETERSKLAAFGDVDAAIAEFRAGKFKHAVETGDDVQTLTLPVGLLRRERSRDEAKATVAAAVSAHQGFASRREVAEGALKTAEQKVTAAAIEILHAEGRVQAERLRQSWRAMWSQFDVLNALANTWVKYADVGLKPVRLDRDSVAILSHIGGFDFRQFPGPGMTGNTELAAGMKKWKAYLEVLSMDPEAQFDELELETIKETEKAA
jgi:hypothetical protein